ncbi:MAG: YkgJ family cysteine cluster protein [Chitinophagaceae bacterium]
MQFVLWRKEDIFRYCCHYLPPTPKGIYLQAPITHLPTLVSEADQREEEHIAFAAMLKTLHTEQLDRNVRELAAYYEEKIDCTACGNCCRSMMINVTREEANVLSAHLQVSAAAFDDQYLEKGMSETMLMNTIPCHFLSNNQCTVYEHRFAGCREFPGLHLPDVQKRLFSIFMHYGRCPIVFNVVNALKLRTGFTYPDRHTKKS